MEIKDHLLYANAYLEMAKYKISTDDFVSAQEALSKAFKHTCELMDHVRRLEDVNAEIELCTTEDSK